MAPTKETTQCNSCNKNITKTQSSLQCSACLHWFHLICSGVSEKAFGALSDASGIYFKCNGCNISPEATDDTAVPDMGNDLRSLHSKMDRLLNKMEEDKNEFKAKLDSAIKDIKGELSSTVTELKNDISCCNTTIKDVESALSTKCSQLETENNGLHRKLNRADIVINGLPAGSDNLLDYVTSIAKFYSIAISKGDIFNVFYINQGRSLIVKFNSVLIRDSIMKEYFKKKDLTLKDVTGRESSSRVYLNDHMTPATGKLNALCKRLLKEKKISKFWLIHSDKPMVRLTCLDGSVVTYDYKECFKLI